MKKGLLILIALPMIGFGQPEYLTNDGKMDFLKDLRDVEGNIMWGNVLTSELSMDFHFTLGTSERYSNHQQKIRNRTSDFSTEADKY